jgi:hypothetical protein
MAGELQATNVVREFVRIQDYFPNVQGKEDSLVQCFQCLDQQIARFATKELVHSDDEILQALAACGLYIYDKQMGRPPRDWSGLPKGARQLAEVFTATFDPDVNEEIKAATQEYWLTANDEQFHFMQWGSVIRRLMASVKRHQKNDPRGYCRWVVTFTARWSPDPSDDKVHWALMSLSQSDTGDALPAE